MRKTLLFLMISIAFGISSCTKEDDNQGNNGSGNENGISGSITENTTWTADKTYLIDGTLTVEGATLTIEPGTVIKFTESSELDVGYSESGSVIIANGTSEKPIRFTSAASSPTSGDWDGIWFYSGTSSETSMTYCIVEYSGGYSDYSGAINLKDCKITLENSHIQYSKHNGLTLDIDASFKAFSNNTVEAVSGQIMILYPNAAHTIGSGNSLLADGNRGVVVMGGAYTMEDETWRALTVPYIIDGTVSVHSPSGSTLRIEAGAVISFSESSELDVAYSSGEYGTIIAKGTNENRIFFTSSSPSKEKGDWDGIWFYDGSNGCEFEFCTFEYGGGYGDYYGMIQIKSSNVSFSNCIFQQSQTYGISLDSEAGFDSFENNYFTDNNNHAIYIYGSYAHTIGLGNDFQTGNKGVFVEGDYIDNSVTWHKLNCPYFVNGTLKVGSSSGATLTIEAGTIIKFTQDSELDVAYGSDKHGSIVAIGTEEEPIYFTSASPAPSSGDWDGIWFYEGTSSATKFDFCVISYGGGYSDYSGNITFKNDGGNITITNTEINHSESWGLYLDNGEPPVLISINFLDNQLGNKNW